MGKPLKINLNLNRISSSNQPSHGLAEMLAENDPFEIVDAMKNVGEIYERSECLKGDCKCCSGCSIFDGMEYYGEHIIITRKLG